MRIWRVGSVRNAVLFRSFVASLAGKVSSRAGVVQNLATSWAADPPQLPFFGPTFANRRSHETMEKHSISRNSYPPKSLMSKTSLLSSIDAARPYRQLSV